MGTYTHVLTPTKCKEHKIHTKHLMCNGHKMHTKHLKYMIKEHKMDPKSVLSTKCMYINYVGGLVVYCVGIGCHLL